MTIPPNVKYQDRFLKAYQEARRRKRGLWGE
jgi:endonuclease YncB( thermonuclease family)